MMYICKKCGKIKSEKDFYYSKKGIRFSKCKECEKKIVAESRSKNYNRYSEYDKKRSTQPHRRKQQRNKAKKQRERYDTASIRYALKKAINNNEIIKPDKCQIKGCENTEALVAHHFDYKKTTDVIWLCPHHHTIYHVGKSEYADKIRKEINEFIIKTFNIKISNIYKPYILY